MDYSKIEIKSKGNPPTILTEVLIDGRPIHGVKSINYSVDADDRIPVVTLDLMAVDVSIDSPHVKIVEEKLGEIEKIVFKD